MHDTDVIRTMQGKKGEPMASFNDSDSSRHVPADDSTLNPQKGEKDGKHSSLLSYLLWILAAFLISFFLIFFVVQRTDVYGNSMYPTLENGDKLLTDKISYRFTDPKRFDIIIFSYNYQPNTYFIKRVIGLPGETVRIDEEGNIYINGELLEEHYGREPMEYAGLAANDFVLGEDEYFVLGDNRNDSEDSRFPDVGAVSRSQILGRAFLRIYPFSRWELLIGK